MPSLQTIANLWTLNRHPRPTAEWSLDRKVAAVAAAGFDGLMAKLTPEHRRAADRHGLRHLVGFVVATVPDEFESQLRAQQAAGARKINVHLGRWNTPPQRAAAWWLRLEQAAAKLGGLELSLETHRDYCTETPEKTYEIAARYHDATGQLIRLTFDFSHWAVVRHLHDGNYAARLLDCPDLLQQARQIHFRPFNGHHCQVPVTWRGRRTPELEAFLVFARAVLVSWRQGNRAAHTELFVCPEMGPDLPHGSGYAITGLGKPWPQAVTMREELVKLWRGLGR
jgi:hypothetical protein